MTRNGLFTLAVAAVLSATPAFSASPGIGVATAVGSYSVNSSPVTGNADVFNGTELRTTISPSDVHLGNGADVRLATRSAGTLYSNCANERQDCRDCLHRRSGQGDRRRRDVDTRRGRNQDGVSEYNYAPRFPERRGSWTSTRPNRRRSSGTRSIVE